jgi:hypothetical protein
MSQPPFPYNRIFDFESFSIVNPTTQQPGVQIEGELDGVKRTLDSVISRLSEIQRDDGYIRDSALDQSTAIPQFYDRLVILFNPTFAQIDQKINLKANIASPTFTGVVNIPANAVIVGYAKLVSPDFTGVPTTPTPAALSDSQQIANTAFVTAADNAVKQYVADNFLSLGGDQMNENSIINWTSITPATQYPAFYSNTITNDISKGGVSLFGKYPVPEGNPVFSFTNRRETIVSQGSIELSEFNTPGVYPVGTSDTGAEWTLKGKIVIWSGQSTSWGGQNPLPILNPLTGPHITLWDKANTYGIKPMMISSNGLQFPDGTNQETRGLSSPEVLSIALQQATIAVENLVDGAPAALDTLKEIADAIGNDADLAGSLTAAISGKANLSHTHSVSDINGLQDALDSTKLQQYDNFKVYSVGDIVLADNRIFRFNAPIGAAGYGPITHPYAWTEQSAQPSLSGYATESFVNAKPGLGNLAYSLNYTDPTVASYTDTLVGVIDAQTGFTYYNLTITSPTDVLVSSYAGYTVSFVTQAGSSNVTYDHVNKTVIFDVNTMAGSGNMQDAFAALNSNYSGWTFGGNLTTAYYVSQYELFGKSFPMHGQTFTIDATDRLVNTRNLWNDITTSVNTLNLSNKLVGTDSTGKFKFHPIEGLASVSGATFVGKVTIQPGFFIPPLNIGHSSAPSSSVAGDIWLGTNTVSYKDATNAVRTLTANGLTNVFSAPQTIDTTATTPAIRITQKGTGNSILIEDATTPDTSAFVIDANGNVGVGVATNYTSTAKVEVVGNVKATTFSNGSGPTFSVTSTASHTGGSDTLDLLVTINGSSYRIGLRPA